MKQRLVFLVWMGICWAGAFGQNFTTYYTGDTADAVVQAGGGICLMGGATEDDNAMRWFLQRCAGGDVLVLRASGSDGYNAYLYSQLGVTVNSVVTIVCNNALASNEPYIHERIQRAEGIWFAGGDQWDYVSYWRGTAIDSLVNRAIHERNIVIGGTSAGMAIMGSHYFSAQNGTVTSATAMGNPYGPAVTPDSAHFLENDWLQDVITDTHYDNPDRRGRHVTFMARMAVDYGVNAKGIACDEYTAVCIDTNGVASVYGGFPGSDDNAYFIQVNCEVPGNAPEVCQPNVPLQWDQNGLALKAYAVKGTANGANTFDLRDWATGNGGTWEAWSVYSNAFFYNPTTAIACGPVAMDEAVGEEIVVWPQPLVDGLLHIDGTGVTTIQICSMTGKIAADFDLHEGAVDLAGLPNGIYCIRAFGEQGSVFKKIIVAR
ncbi:MAG: Type 1 glutamine amidotransferase-like domain-containing protein [Bacteroidia bacterium]